MIRIQFMSRTLVGFFGECHRTLFLMSQFWLVQVMAWCRQAPSHYLIQCWFRVMPPYGVTRPQWVKNCVFISLPNINRLSWYGLTAAVAQALIRQQAPNHQQALCLRSLFSIYKYLLSNDAILRHEAWSTFDQEMAWHDMSNTKGVKVLIHNWWVVPC